MTTKVIVNNPAGNGRETVIQEVRQGGDAGPHTYETLLQPGQSHELYVYLDKKVVIFERPLPVEQS